MTMRQFILHANLLAMLLIMSAAPSYSRTLADETLTSSVVVNNVRFDAAITIGDTSVPLKGAALFEWIKFDVYTGAFYAPADARGSAGMLAIDTPRALILHYHRPIKARDFIKSGEHFLKKNPTVNLEKMRPSLDKINAAYRDVRKGDEYKLVYEPGQGTTLFLNNVSLVKINDAEFARAYFGIWLSDHSLDSELATALRGE